MTGRLKDLWGQECGLRDVLWLGLPLVVSTSSFAFMYFCDRLFLTWYSTMDMAAVMQSSALSWSTVAFPMGMAAYSMAFVAQYRGALQSHRIGAVFWQAARIAIYSIPLIVLIAILAPLMFYAFKHEEDLVLRETLYFRIMAVGLPGVILSAAMNSFFVGLERTRVVMVIDLTTALLNVVLDYAMIFGFAFIPEMGLAGAAWATVISIWVKVVAYALLMRLQADLGDFHFADGFGFDRALLGRILKFGGPNGLQFFLEGSAFTIVLMFLGKLGPLALGATTLAISVNMVAFVPMIGIAMAISTMVGNQIGRKRPDLAKRATWNGVAIASTYSALFAIAYVTVPQWFLIFHDLENLGEPELQAWAEFLLLFVAAYCVFDAWQLVFSAAIKGAGDTLFTVVTLLGATTLLVVVGALGEQLWQSVDSKIIWWWAQLTGFLCLLAIVFFVRFLGGRWQRMKVIESLDAADEGIDDGGLPKLSENDSTSEIEIALKASSAGNPSPDGNAVDPITLP